MKSKVKNHNFTLLSIIGAKSTLINIYIICLYNQLYFQAICILFVHTITYVSYACIMNIFKCSSRSILVKSFDYLYPSNLFTLLYFFMINSFIFPLLYKVGWGFQFYEASSCYGVSLFCVDSSFVWLCFFYLYF